jgi:hypothetical protein
MTPNEAAAQLDLLRAAYPDARTKVGPDTAAVWIAMLRRLDRDLGRKAVQSLIEGCKFWPSIAELNEQVVILREQARGERQAAERREDDLAHELMPRVAAPAACAAAACRTC